ncbi:Hypothetical predicted protein [Pelobates cultripes]|uniref:MD-2-related lipid-recognition domain-containing protein n=1 Tax=Pelobates cultripes TaxID=61616 RepID=A0AAD1W5K7_PELCU|nr:Hypothetical predicted protein [Pelobates cultripes]
MKTVIVFVFGVNLLCPGENKEWPTHTLCKTKDLESYYKSCDPFQDFGLSILPCDKYLDNAFAMKIGIILRRDANKMRTVLKLSYDGKYLIAVKKLICDDADKRYSFCGRKKGEYLQIDQTVTFHLLIIPKGNYFLELELFNEDDFKLACANITIISS